VFTVVSYYTDSFYEQLAEGLRRSCEALDLKNDIERVDDSGSRLRNLHYKVPFLRRKMAEHEGSDLLWIDADSIVLSPPQLLLEDGDYDLAATFWQEWFCYSATLFLRNNAASRALLDLWEEENTRRSHLLDDQNLTSVLLTKPAIRILRLPFEYAWTERWLRGKEYPYRPVILHLEISRREKSDLAQRSPA